MPKLKTKKSASKRFKKSSQGLIKRFSANTSHIKTKMTTKRKRHLRKSKTVSSANKLSVSKQMPYA